MARIKSITPIANSGLTDTVSGEVFDQISMFAGYGFNKSHAAAYAATSFHTAYLKTHHPEAYFAAAMNLDLSEVDEIAVFASEMKTRQIVLWPPSINSSQATFKPIRLSTQRDGRDFGITYALSAIRGVGRSAADAIDAARSAGPFKDVRDFMSRTTQDVGKKALESLAKAGAFDCFKISRSEALAIVAGRDTRSDVRQVSMFDFMADAAPQVTIQQMTWDEELDAEFDVLGHFMTAHPLDTLKPRLFDEGLYFSGFVLGDSNGQMRKARLAAVVTAVDVRRTKTGDIMAVVSLSDPEGTYEALAFSETWGAISHSFTKKARLVVAAQVSHRGDERRLIIENVEPMPKPRKANGASSPRSKVAQPA